MSSQNLALLKPHRFNSDIAMSVRLDDFPPGEEYPPRADLRKDVYSPLPKIVPSTIDPAAIMGDVPAIYARALLRDGNAALASSDAEKLAECFYLEHAFC